MVVALAYFYVKYGELAWMQRAFYGVGAAVIAVIARSAMKLAKMTLAKDLVLWILFAVSALVTAVTESEIVWLFLASGAVAWAVETFRHRAALAFALPPALVSGLHGAASGSVLAQIAWFFTKAGAFVFGSGLAIVPVLYKGVVKDFGWLTDHQFRDAVAVAMITPGPVVITSGFIGYLTAGVLGASVAAACTFLPPYLIVITAARWMRRASQNARLKAFVVGVTASATGAIAGAAFILGRRSIVDAPTALIAAGAFASLLFLKRVPEPVLILVAAGLGVALRRAG
jgi:chromate transporter